MSGKEISDIIFSFGVVGWIPIYFLFSGITKVVNAIKGNNTKEGGIEVSCGYKDDEKDEKMNNDKNDDERTKG